MKHLVMATMLTLALALPPAVAGQTGVSTEFSPEVESQAREVGKSLRCVVCQNQSIEDSAAPLAADMRQIVRERLASGDTPAEVREFMTDRYGNFVLMKPPFQLNTLFLWVGPALFVLLGALGWAFYLRPKSRELTPVAQLTDDEQAQLDAILSDKRSD